MKTLRKTDNPAEILFFVVVVFYSSREGGGRVVASGPRNYIYYSVKLSGEAASASREAEKKWIGGEGYLWVRLFILVKLLCIGGKCPPGPTGRETQAPGFKGCEAWPVVQRQMSVVILAILTNFVLLRALVPAFSKFRVVWSYSYFFFKSFFFF